MEAGTSTTSPSQPPSLCSKGRGVGSISYPITNQLHYPPTARTDTRPYRQRDHPPGEAALGGLGVPLPPLQAHEAHPQASLLLLLLGPARAVGGPPVEEGEQPR